MCDNHCMQPLYVRYLYEALTDRHALDFFTQSIKESYLEFYSAYKIQIEEMIDKALELLLLSQKNGPSEAALHDAVELIKKRIMKKNNDLYWFNKIYADYKINIRPKRDLALIQKYISGKTVLDFGCGGGYLALSLSKLGLTVYLTDVLDYRIGEALSMPFSVMQNPYTIPYYSIDFDTSIVKTVLHHVDKDNIPLLISELSRVSNRVIIEEDTYDVHSNDIENYKEAYNSQPRLRQFLSLAPKEQYHALILIDYFANAVALGSLGVPEINFSFEFKPPCVWKSMFEANDFELKHSVLFGFEKEKMHKNCQVWMVFDKKR